MYEIEYTPQAVGDVATIASSALMLEKQPASIKLCTEHDAKSCMSVADSSVSSPVQSRDDYDIFISYSRKDKEFVSQLCEALTQAKQKIWVDWMIFRLRRTGDKRFIGELKRQITLLLLSAPILRR